MLLENMTSMIHPLNWHCCHTCAPNAKRIHAVPSGVRAAMAMARSNAMREGELASTQCYAMFAMELAKAGP
jgi:hypothetical protein